MAKAKYQARLTTADKSAWLAAGYSVKRTVGSAAAMSEPQAQSDAVETLRAVNEHLKKQHTYLCELSGILQQMRQRTMWALSRCEDALVAIAESGLLPEEETA